MHDGPTEDLPAKVCIAQRITQVGTDQHNKKITWSAECPFPARLSEFMMWELKLSAEAPRHWC